jgi:hypothetical protein
VVLVATSVLPVSARKAHVAAPNAPPVAAGTSLVTATTKVSVSALPQQIQHPVTAFVVKMLDVTNHH